MHRMCARRGSPPPCARWVIPGSDAGSSRTLPPPCSPVSRSRNGPPTPRPGGAGGFAAARVGRLEHGGRLLGAEALQALADVRVRAGEDGDGEERGVHGPGTADGERADGDPGRHLRHREQRVEPARELRLHRDTQHGERRLRGDGARQGGRHPGARDDHLHAPLLGGRGVVRDLVRCAMRREDEHLVRDLESVECLRRVPHRLPVGAGAHDHTDERLTGHRR